jgi:hypothetical protein
MLVAFSVEIYISVVWINLAKSKTILFIIALLLQPNRGILLYIKISVNTYNLEKKNIFGTDRI